MKRKRKMDNKPEEGKTNQEEETPKKRMKNHRRGPLRHLTKEIVIDALEQAGGIINHALKIGNIGRGEFYRKYRNDPEIDATIKRLHREGFDQIQDTLFTLAAGGNIKAIALYIKYNPVAKDEGWRADETVILKDDKPLTDEEKDALKKEIFG
jgi:hypothetical protein